MAQPHPTAPGTSPTVLGYPRQGPDRRLKKLIEGYWAGRLDAADLLDGTRQLRGQRWREMAEYGLAELPSNDFSLYDHVLDTAVMVGAIPRRHREAAPDDGTPRSRLDRYFAMARGTADVAPLEMTKWFDTNYHYLVPELHPHNEFHLDADKPLGEFAEATAAGFTTRPVVVGPVSFLLLSKPAPDADPTFEPLALLDRLLPLYVDLLAQLRAAGAEWVQLDEPALVLDQPAEVLNTVERAYRILTDPPDRPKVLVASYFDRLGDALPILADSPVEGLAIDITGPAAADIAALAALGGVRGKRLVAGVVEGRNIWRTDLTAALAKLGTLLGLADRVDVAASCSLLHVPLDVTDEKDLDPQIVPWFAFARQKLDELTLLARALTLGRDAVVGDLQVNRSILASRASSPITRNPAVRNRAVAVTADDTTRTSGYEVRTDRQRERLNLPPLPTTTIGSFPQTRELRRARADLRAGRLDDAAYTRAMRAEVASVIAEQERLGLDVLVHGEPERNDMVQYFAERLAGYVATSHGWVQSYGTRYVRPPILAGDVFRPAPMTVDWTTYAQSLTARPVKGMLTGPVTMLAWSFVRDDQPLGDTAAQVALALRDEVLDLEAAGVPVIQVDEPALRETLPLRAADRPGYLAWAVRAFRLATAGVADHTQIHTHMCYADFADILGAIIDLDADVISLEAARSDMGITRELTAAGYPNEVGPGVWDIHSPRVPSADEIEGRLREATAAFPAERLWVNPDCGLKTRAYPETLASLENLVTAARRVRGGE
jgi:5-methyltetrahydropteroyltriglutamate--homocysteine methyltransferase